MPELPEVEVIRRELAPLVCGKEFAAPVIHFAGAVHYPAAEQFRRLLGGRRIRDLGRKGKYIFFFAGQGDAAGTPADDRPLDLPRCRRDCCRGLHLAVETFEIGAALCRGDALFFYDQRKFGGFWLLENPTEWEIAGLPRLGPDIWEEVDGPTFLALLQARPRARIKALLLDQGFVAGMGNIYTDESLFRSGIHPCRCVSTLSVKERENLYRAIREVLAEGIACGGTTTRDYLDARGSSGTFQERLAVYGCKGEPCSRCGRPVERTVTAGRGTYFCPCCQK